MFETQQEIYEKIKLNMQEVNRKLEKNKVNMVTDFVERTETSRISTLQKDFLEEHKDISEAFLDKANQRKYLAKHKTDIMREMLHTKYEVNIDEISLHSSDGSDIISSTEKKLSELERDLQNQLSRSSLTYSKVSKL